MWKLSWVNFTMDLASIPDHNDKNKEDKLISANNEADELIKDLGL